ncbi:MAG: RsmB/NOP family class I SAM-dependent RNA methyltransferase [Prevotellaceae bacterium]|jgi:16S rRNA C967 or C1407 C5-methylase (RsmB/RsmF family)/NOL1/NOP2/fmu family ribosome biogenesis protein|nr:RsmB/NOP family class I SAM-dependent RNA methyltransferase [Prevotellaceae bacterium]
MLTLPDIFLQRTKNILNNEFDDFINALNGEPLVSLRKNSQKNTDISGCGNVAWCDNGIYLQQRASFTLDPDFHAGAYYIQEASSMFLEQAIKQNFQNKNKIIALDLCAAPGGKSTHLLSLLPENSLLVANDVIRSRAKILYENVLKWGYSNVAVTANDPKDFSQLEDFFDLILIDAPCSGEGMFRKDNKAVSEWSVDNVKLCAERQQRILADAWKSLKYNGLLIYCTCTYNTDENEENVKWMIDNFDAKSVQVKTQAEWGITENLIPEIFSYRFYPHKTKGEGFCLSVLRKSDSSTRFYEKKENYNQKNIPKNFDFVRTYLSDSEKYNFVISNDVVKAVYKEIANEINIVSNRLRCLSAGITAGTIKGKNFVPSHALAMSVDLNRKIFSKINADRLSALKFLHKDNIHFNSETIGYNLVCYNDNVLGWVKNIGNRTNNLYPQEWRILMDIK